MKLQQNLAGYFPRPLLFIAATTIPVALVCNYLAQLRDVHPAQGTMTAQAIAARLTPVAYVVPVLADAKVSSAGLPAVSASN